MEVDYNVPIPMRDGTRLSAVICRPGREGRFPCVLSRSCYTKWTYPLADRMQYWTSHGYVLALQDVRGRGDSDGVFYPIINEREDGLDTLDWVCAQPWSNGRIVMFGGSYSGWTQLYLGGTNHRGLAALATIATPPDPDRSFPLYHGIPVPAAAAWLASLDGRTNQDLSTCDVTGAFAALPIIDFDHHIGRHLTAWRDWVSHTYGAAYWARQSYQRALLRSRIPMLHISGWYDDCLLGTLENFAAMTKHRHDLPARGGHRMIIGPWTHGNMGQRRTGAFDYGPDAEIDLLALHRQWFDRNLNGTEDYNPPVSLFVLGRNKWITANEWPVRGTTYVPYYLHSNGHANSRMGDGKLAFSAPTLREPPDTFRYDPASPFPYCSDFDWKQVGGPDDFANAETRDDVLVYTGPELTEPLLICGPLVVHLFAASSARDTDWTAKVLEVYPDGRSIRLSDGAVRARFRRGDGTEHFLTAGDIEEYAINCGAICIELAISHRLRVEISSSAFGKLDVNLNGGGPIGREVTPIVARQTIYHDTLYPSHVVLPLIRARVG